MPSETRTREAGRELDAEVAERVMGTVAWDVVIDGCSRGGRECATREAAEAYRQKLAAHYLVGPVVLHDHVPYYSSSIAAAWSVVEKLDHICNIEWVSGWATVDFTDNIGGDIKTLGRAHAKTLPLAICLAALASRLRQAEEREANAHAMRIAHVRDALTMAGEDTARLDWLFAAKSDAAYLNRDRIDYWDGWVVIDPEKNEVVSRHGEDFRATIDAASHRTHGKGADGPDDPDCPCRATPREAACADAGCGFCRATRSTPTDEGRTDAK